MTTVVHLGNPAAIDAATRQPLDGDRVTEVHAPEGKDAYQILAEVIDPGGIWAAHSVAPAPSWVSSSNPEVAEVIADHYECPVFGFEEV